MGGVVAQLTQPLLPSPEDQGSNVIVVNLFSVDR